MRELARLDKSIGRRIVARIAWLATNLDAIKPEALTGDLAGFYKLRMGDYRVIDEILHEVFRHAGSRICGSRSGKS